MIPLAVLEIVCELACRAGMEWAQCFGGKQATAHLKDMITQIKPPIRKRVGPIHPLKRFKRHNWSVSLGASVIYGYP